jgi:hypothetical protein
MPSAVLACEHTWVERRDTWTKCPAAQSRPQSGPGSPGTPMQSCQKYQCCGAQQEQQHQSEPFPQSQSVHGWPVAGQLHEWFGEQLEVLAEHGSPPPPPLMPARAGAMSHVLHRLIAPNTTTSEANALLRIIFPRSGSWGLAGYPQIQNMPARLR